MGERTIPIAVPDLGEEEWQALREPLFTGWVTQGPRVAAFEAAFAERHQVPHGIATTSGTTALQLILSSMGVGDGDEVIVPSFTWVATANAVVHCGARPVLADVDPKTFNLDAADIAERVTPATRCIIPVHLFGLCADMDGIARAAPGVALVEDAACAAGGAYGERPAGSLGVAAGFSFHPRKSITTGEGGMITTADGELAERARRLRNHGSGPVDHPWQLPDPEEAGFNYRMTDLQGAVGVVQLGKLDRFIDARAALAATYAGQLADIDWLAAPSAPQTGRHAWQAYVCMVEPGRDRNQVIAELGKRGIGARPGTQAVHMLAYYRNRFGYAPDDLPGARACMERSLALPLHTKMTSDDVGYVVDALRGL